MQCHRCFSPRIIRFLDGFGHRRLFCKSCHESFPLQAVMVAQKKLFEFREQGVDYERNSNIAAELA